MLFVRVITDYEAFGDKSVLFAGVITDYEAFGDKSVLFVRVITDYEQAHTFQRNPAHLLNILRGKVYLSDSVEITLSDKSFYRTV